MIHLLTKADPLKSLLSQPALSGRTARWLLKLSEFEIVCLPQRAIKGQAIADWLADNPVDDPVVISDDLPDEEVFSAQHHRSWTFFFDGTSAAGGGGIGFVFLSPEGVGTNKQ